MILKTNTIKKLNSLLKLPATGNEQDWDIELADFKRIEEFIDFFFKNEETLNEEEKKSIAALILASYDDYLNNHIHNENLWTSIKSILKSDKYIYNELVDYWSINNKTEAENHFNITPLCRLI